MRFYGNILVLGLALGLMTTAASADFLNEDDSLQLQLASTHGLEAIFDKYDRFSANCTKKHLCQRTEITFVRIYDISLTSQKGP